MPRRYLTKLFTVVLYFTISLTGTALSISHETKQASKIPLEPHQLIEAKRIGIMIGQRKPFLEIHNLWKGFVTRSKVKQNDISTILLFVFQEAKQEIDTNKVYWIERLKEYNAIAARLGEELGRLGDVMEQEQQGKTSKVVCRKKSDLIAGRVGAKQKEVISTRAEINACIHTLRRELSLARHDAQLANVALQNALCLY